MPKKLFEDMVKAKNSGRQAPKDIRREVPRESERVQREPAHIPQREIPRIEIDRREYSPAYKKRSRSGLWLVAFVSIVFFIFALSFFFARAQVTVTPKVKDLTLNENLSAIKDVNTDGVAFDLVILSGEDTKSVSGGAETDVAQSSKGSIFLYNTFSTAPQKIAINSKLEGSNGKIYKTSTEVSIPGIAPDGTTGKVAVGIYGGDAGADYDSGPLDFKIAGFKGTSKYDKFYGRSDGPISGGFKGKSVTVSDADKQAAFAELEVSLKEKLFKKAQDQIPDGFILYPDAAFTKIDEETVGFNSRDSSSLPVNVKGTLYGFLFNEKTLTEKIAKDNITDYNDEPVYIPNIKDLTFKISSDQISYSDVQNINFNLSGSARIVWKFDDTGFMQSLLGKSKKDFDQILSAYPNVDSAQLTISPFWVRSIPEKSKDIKIKVDYPE